MPCYRPLHGHRAAGGRPSFTRSADAYVDLPITVSCGVCIGCRKTRSRDWQTRILHELQTTRCSACSYCQKGEQCIAPPASFLTLTYDDAHLPIDWSVSSRPIKLFMKSLRKTTARKLRYFMVAEYGETTLRPHYHMALFGEDFASDREHHRTTDRGDRLYTSDRLSGLWKRGHALIGDLNATSAAYIARYCTKKITGDAAAYHYRRIDPLTGEVFETRPEFSTQSKGIGKKWIEQWADEVYPRDEVVVDGKLRRPPKYYDRQQPEEVQRAMKKKRAQFAASQDEADQTYWRLQTRENVQEAASKVFAREPGRQ